MYTLPRAFELSMFQASNTKVVLRIEKHLLRKIMSSQEIYLILTWLKTSSHFHLHVW